MQLVLSISRHSDAATAPVEARFGGVDFTIGRASDNDLVLDDPAKYISRLHARVLFRDGRHVYTDVGTNPSLINDRPLGQGKEHALAHGDRIEIGDYLLQACLQDAAAGGAAARAPNVPNVPSVPSVPSVPIVPTAPEAMAPTGPSMLSQPTVSPSGSDMLAAAAAPGRTAAVGAFAGIAGMAGMEAAHAPDALAAADILRADASAASVAMGDDPLGLLADAPLAAAPPAPRIDAVTLPEAQPLPPMQASRPATTATAIPADYDPLADLVAAQPRPAPTPAPSSIPSPSPVAPSPSALATSPPAQITPQPGAGASDGDPVLDALLRGLGLPQLASERPAAELAEQIGAMLRVAAAGTMQALRARALAKKEGHIEMTMMAAGANNPLKFFPDALSALNQMLGHKSGAYMSPVQAFGNAFGDLRAHELAMMAGVRAALASMLARFDPDAIEAQVDAQSGAAGALGRLLHLRRKARCWEAFVHLHQEMARGAGEEFQRLFTESFAPAYEEQMERIRQRGA